MTVYTDLIISTIVDKANGFDVIVFVSIRT